MEALKIKNLQCNGVDFAVPGEEQNFRKEKEKLRPVDVILKKRNGLVLTRQDMHEFVRMAVDGSMSESQIGKSLTRILISRKVFPQLRAPRVQRHREYT